MPARQAPPRALAGRRRGFLEAPAPGVRARPVAVELVRVELELVARQAWATSMAASWTRASLTRARAALGADRTPRRGGAVAEDRVAVAAPAAPERAKLAPVEAGRDRAEMGAPARGQLGAVGRLRRRDPAGPAGVAQEQAVRVVRVPSIRARHPDPASSTMMVASSRSRLGITPAISGTGSIVPIARMRAGALSARRVGRTAAPRLTARTAAKRTSAGQAGSLAPVMADKPCPIRTPPADSSSCSW